MNALARLRHEFDRVAEAGRRIDLWWRDDDAVTDSPALDRLLDIAQAVDRRDDIGFPKNGCERLPRRMWFRRESCAGEDILQQHGRPAMPPLPLRLGAGDVAPAERRQRLQRLELRAAGFG